MPWAQERDGTLFGRKDGILRANKFNNILTYLIKRQDGEPDEYGKAVIVLSLHRILTKSTSNELARRLCHGFFTGQDSIRSFGNDLFSSTQVTIKTSMRLTEHAYDDQLKTVISIEELNEARKAVDFTIECSEVHELQYRRCRDVIHKIINNEIKRLMGQFEETLTRDCIKGIDSLLKRTFSSNEFDNKYGEPLLSNMQDPLLQDISLSAIISEALVDYGNAPPSWASLFFPGEGRKRIAYTRQAIAHPDAGEGEGEGEGADKDADADADAQADKIKTLALILAVFDSSSTRLSNLLCEIMHKTIISEDHIVAYADEPTKKQITRAIYLHAYRNESLLELFKEKNIHKQRISRAPKTATRVPKKCHTALELKPLAPPPQRDAAQGSEHTKVTI